MKKEKYVGKSVGEVVADNYAAARVFAGFGIDFCCHGEVLFDEACTRAGVSPEEVLKALEASETMEAKPVAGGFSEWPLDLLIDYVLKIHHRGIRRDGPQILKLMDKVVSVHGEAHQELYEVCDLFTESLQELEMHLQKEENVLFPYLFELYDASLVGRPMEQMHCGTVSNPIRVMRMEHESEGNRYHHIVHITRNYAVPADGCASYRLLMHELKRFMEALFEHIHLENNIIFPKAVELEAEWVG
ncbi:iron-sulfur cluster repair di-iron protein [uncultured Bacteroides sp.]|uniref:iron-sulfur cluster repair di-iron protein n=1 Tax=uncultured Bacteroides sp. TaxID=162156 RepID=UPI00262969A8|nr:iron-sulfur cluster repair di-iron protein [uncultured Bacteroides sp.]